MAKATITEWESQINGKDYKISYERIKGKHVVTVNGEPTTVKCGFMSAMIGFDEKFMIDGNEARLVIARNKPDIVVNGVFLQSGKEYIHRPAWAMGFALACVLIPIVSLGGALPILFGIGGATLCINVSRSSMSTLARVISCTFITLAAWILWFVMIVGFSMLQ